MQIGDPRRFLQSWLNVLLVLSSAFMFYKGLGVVTNSSSPVVVVLSGSMEPAFQRGDILFLWNREKHLKLGDVVVYNVKGRDIPIVHRVVRHHTSDRKQLLLTKGDNNALDDLDLYGHKQTYLNREEDINGVVKGYLPKLGYLTILMTENKHVKTIVLGLMCVVSFIQGE